MTFFFFLKSTSFFFFFTYLFWLRHAACKILVPRPGIEPAPPYIGSSESYKSLDHQGSPLKHDFQFHFQTQESFLTPQHLQDQSRYQVLCILVKLLYYSTHVLSHLLTISPLQQVYESSFSPLLDGPAPVLTLPNDHPNIPGITGISYSTYTPKHIVRALLSFYMAIFQLVRSLIASQSEYPIPSKISLNLGSLKKVANSKSGQEISR